MFRFTGTALLLLALGCSTPTAGPGGTVPVVVTFQTHPDRWPKDTLEILDARVSGDLMDVRVWYTGGCRNHDVKAVAWGGWMESFPVQVKVYLSHDDRNDTCEAAVTRDLLFDLRPLRNAYRASYGTGGPGATTLWIDLDGPVPPYASQAWLLKYVF